MDATDTIRDAESAAWLEARRISIPPFSADALVGVDHALAAGRSVLGRLAHPSLVPTVPSLLLYGEPGTGKTLVARWIVAASRLPAYDLASGDLDAGLIRSAFAHLADQPRSLIALSEIDVIGLDRRSLAVEPRRALVALLEALDGLRPNQAGCGPAIIATSNLGPAKLDAALARRLGTHVRFTVPGEPERKRLFALQAVGRPVAPSVNWASAAAATAGWSGADIRDAIEEAFGLALDREGADAAIRPDDVAIVIRRARSVTTADKAPSEADLARIRHHEAAHVACAVRLGLPLRSVRVGLDGGSGWTETGSEEREAPGDAQVMAQVVVALAGSAGEELLGSPSHGSREDVTRATRLLIRRVEAGVDPAFPPASRSAWGDWTPRVLDEAMLPHVLEQLDLAREQARRIVREEATRIAGFAAELEASPMLAGEALEAALARVGWQGAKTKGKRRADVRSRAPSAPARRGVAESRDIRRTTGGQLVWSLHDKHQSLQLPRHRVSSNRVPTAPGPRTRVHARADQPIGDRGHHRGKFAQPPAGEPVDAIRIAD